MHAGEAIKVHACHLQPSSDRMPAGMVARWDRDGLVVSTGLDYLCITQLQFPGKRAMSARRRMAR